MLSNELETAKRLALEAGDAILRHYGTDLVVEKKLGVDAEYEPVTVADREASRMIVDELARSFPDDAVLSEEEPDDLRRLGSPRTWMIDPIDGTAGFVKKDGDFSIQIGLTTNGRPTLGVVYQPFHNILHFAVSGSGAFAIESGGSVARLGVSAVSRFADMTMAMTRNHPTARIRRVIEHFGFTRIEKRGSVGLKTGLIASGSCDIYIHPSPRTKLWDTCAPQVILEEAGGRLTDIFGDEIRYDGRGLQNLNGILASNAASHDAAVEHLRPLLAEFGRVKAA